MRGRFLIPLILLVLLVMCGQPAGPPEQPLGTIGALQANPPPPMQSVLVSGWRGMGLRCPAGRCRYPKQLCPRLLADDVFTEQWMPSKLIVDNMTHIPNLPIEELIAPPMPWLLLVSAEPLSDYHMQLEGHLGDPTYAHCPYADHIFVVERVAWTYADQGVVVWPSDPGAFIHLPTPEMEQWREWKDEALGYGISVPPGATVTPLAAEGEILGGVIINLPQATVPMRIEVRHGMVMLDMLDPRVRSPVLIEGDISPFTQRFDENEVSPQARVPLEGIRQLLRPQPREAEIRTWFEAGGRIYGLGMRVPLGAEADQAALLTYGVIVNSFVATAPQTPTPTPVIQQTVGPGPFLDQATAWTKVEAAFRSMFPTEPQYTVIKAVLLSELATRRLGNGGCARMNGHVQGAWVFHVQAGEQLSRPPLILVADAMTGRYMCVTGFDPTFEPMLPPSMLPGTTP